MDLKVFEFDEDGCAQTWIVAESEEEARALAAEFSIPADDDTVVTITECNADELFTLGGGDDPIDEPLPEAAEVIRRDEHGRIWSIRATHRALAAYNGKGILASTEW